VLHRAQYPSYAYLPEQTLTDSPFPPAQMVVAHPPGGALVVVVVVVVGAMTTATMTAGGLEVTGADATLMSVAGPGVGHQGGTLPPGVTTLMRATGGSQPGACDLAL
jgi:hypothetical protein